MRRRNVRRRNMGSGNTGGRWIKMAAVSVAVLSMGLAACSSEGKPGIGTTGLESGAQAAHETDERRGNAAEQTTAGQTTAGQTTAGQTTAGQTEIGQTITGPKEAALTTAEQTEAMTSEAYKAELRLELPEDGSMFSQASVIQQDDKVVQIQFHDENTGADAIIWASLEAEGGPSEYYVFDEDGIRQETVDTGFGGQLEMKVRKTVENSDIHGILISWEYNGVYYELWEDDAREQADRVLQMAAAIAAQSIAMPDSGNR